LKIETRRASTLKAISQLKNLLARLEQCGIQIGHAYLGGHIMVHSKTGRRDKLPHLFPFCDVAKCNNL
jgi:hypothetical protein